MSRLIVKLCEFLDEDFLVESKEQSQAKELLDNSTMPGGDKWVRKVDLSVGFDGASFSSIKSNKTNDGVIFRFNVDMTPGKISSGGSGVTIDSAAANYYFNLAGTGKDAINGMKLAFDKKVKASIKDIGKEVHRWFGEEENWVHRIVGMHDKDNWKVKDIKIVEIKPGKTMIDPSRRKWASGRTEIWAPLSIAMQIIMKRKGA